MTLQKRIRGEIAEKAHGEALAEIIRLRAEKTKLRAAIGLFLSGRMPLFHDNREVDDDFVKLAKALD